ncbi:MAG: glycosyltransferase family 4 protein [Candidatus Paceibacterota bacterium]
MSHKPVKVLMFGWEFPPHNSGGLGTACLGLTRALCDGTRGVDLTFVLPKKQETVSMDTSFVFADSYSVNMKVRIVDSLLSPYLNTESYKDYYHLLSSGEKSFYGNTLFDEVEQYAERAGAIALEEEFDVIHAHDWLAFDAGIHAREISKKPLVVQVHATEFDRTGGNAVHGHVFEIEKRGMTTADKIISVSSLTKNIIIDKYNISDEKIEVVHNGNEMRVKNLTADETVSSLQVLKDKGKDIVLFVGRITLQKGLEYFLYAAKTVLEYRPNTVFIVAGSGDMAEQMMRLTAKLGISKNVLFTGFLRGKELEEVYDIADLFIMPSVSEPFGLTALEAIDRDTPVILSNQSGVSEVVKNALRVDFWDSDAMADKIISVLSHPSLANELEQNALKELPQISWANAADKCSLIYKALTAQSAQIMK